MDIRRCYDLFLTDRKVSGCRESTLRFYEYVIEKLIHYLTSTDSDSSVEDLQTHILPFFSQRWSPKFGQRVKLDSDLTWKDMES